MAGSAAHALAFGGDSLTGPAAADRRESKENLKDLRGVLAASSVLIGVFAPCVTKRTA
jgi:hypothetical protein